MQRVSQIVAGWLVTVQAISEDDKELYAYAVYSFLFGLIPIALSLAFGIISGMIAESFFLIVPFIIIRKFSGGFHLKSALLCFILTSCLLASALVVVHLIEIVQQHILLSIAVIIATTVIFVFSPIDSEERALNNSEIVQYRIIARIISVVFLIGYFLLVWIGNSRIFIPVGVGIVMVALLQIPCIILNALSKRSLIKSVPKS